MIMTVPYLTSGMVNEQPVSIGLFYRDEGESELPIIEMTVTLPMSYQDIDATLWDALSGNTMDAIVGDAATARKNLLEHAIHSGSERLVELCRKVDRIRPDDADAPLLAAMRHRIRELFPAPGHNEHPALPHDTTPMGNR